MFCLERTYFSVILNPLQKLFRSPSPRSEEFFSPSCNLVDFSSSSALSLPDRLKLAFLFHGVEQCAERSSAEVYFARRPRFKADLLSPSARRFDDASHHETN